MRDGAALGWRLQHALLQGDDAILDSYGAERSAHVNGFIDMSVRFGQLINQTAAGVIPEGRMTTPAPSLGPGLSGDHPLYGTLAPQAGNPDERADNTMPGGAFHLLCAEPLDVDLPVLALPGGWTAAQAAHAVLIRPDGYVLDVAMNTAEVDGMLDRHRFLWVGLSGPPDGPCHH